MSHDGDTILQIPTTAIATNVVNFIAGEGPATVVCGGDEQQERALGLGRYGIENGTEIFRGWCALGRPRECRKLWESRRLFESKIATQHRSRPRALVWRHLRSNP